jgi:L-asparaginase II
VTTVLCDIGSGQQQSEGRNQGACHLLTYCIFSTEISHGYERTAASYHTQESSRLRNSSRLARGLGSFVKAFEDF